MVLMMPKKPIDPIVRFERLYIPEPNSGCWLWTGALSVGYGSFRIADKTHNAHRYSYETYVGPIPKGLELDHLCRNRACVNPDHLEPVTRRENLHRSPIFDGNKTNCPRGHAYDAENTYHDGRGRRCRQCKRDRDKRERGRRRLERANVGAFACD